MPLQKEPITLGYWKMRATNQINLIQELEQQKKSATSARALKSFEELIASRRKILGTYLDEIRDYSSGNLIKISGQYWFHKTSDTEIRQDFEVYITAVSVEEALEIFESQVFHLVKFIPETISYQIFKLKTIINL